jgi:uncharacterized membrane protein YkvA (DUF1232 family)
VIPARCDNLAAARRSIARSRFVTIGSTLGIARRAELALSVLDDPSRPPDDRRLAAAALVYLLERDDLIPDDLGALGMLDDDYVLRSVVRHLFPGDPSQGAHWAELAASVLQEVPLLENLRLTRGGANEAITWFDRANAYLAYRHVAAGGADPLVLVTPSAETSPTYALITLLAYALLDDLTTPSSSTASFSAGDVVCVDGKDHARFLGRSPGHTHLVTLEFRDGRRHISASWLHRLTPAPDWKGRLSKATCLPKGEEPVQRVFGWDDAIGMSAFASSVVFVGRRELAARMLGGLEANGIDLIERRLVTFLDRSGMPIDGGAAGPLVVSPSLEAVRGFCASGHAVRALLVHGARRLSAEKWHLPFLAFRQGRPAVVCWAEIAECSQITMDRLPRPLHVVCWTKDEIAEVVRMHVPGDNGPVPRELRPLARAARVPRVTETSVLRPPAEAKLAAQLSRVLRIVSERWASADFLTYRVAQIVGRLRDLLATTPTRGDLAKPVIRERLRQLDELWRDASEAYRHESAELEAAIGDISSLLEALDDGPLAKALALSATAKTIGTRPLHVICMDPMDAELAAEHLNRESSLVIRASSDLVTGEEVAWCVVPGWIRTRGALRVEQASPANLTLLLDDDERRKWSAFRTRAHPGGEGLAWQSAQAALQGTPAVPALPNEEFDSGLINVPSGALSAHRSNEIDCALVWLDDESLPRALPVDGRVLVLGSDRWVQRTPPELEPGDQIVLPTSYGDSDAQRLLARELMVAIDGRNPALVAKAREWRRCLEVLAQREDLDAEALSRRMARVGVQRGEQTVGAWLDELGSDIIQPQDPEPTLRALWTLIGPLARFSVEEVIEAGRALRRLHQQAGHATWAAWKGARPTVPVDDAWLMEWARKARTRAQRHVVDQVMEGRVARELIGWPIPDQVLRRGPPVVGG